MLDKEEVDPIDLKEFMQMNDEIILEKIKCRACSRLCNPERPGWCYKTPLQYCYYCMDLHERKDDFVKSWCFMFEGPCPEHYLADPRHSEEKKYWYKQGVRAPALWSITK